MDLKMNKCHAIARKLNNTLESGQQLERIERGKENVVGLPRRLKKIAKS